MNKKRLHPLRAVSKKNKKGLASVILAPIRLIRIGTVYTNRKKVICQPFLSFFAEKNFFRLIYEKMFGIIFLVIV